ncbi:Rof/RNase P-like protein [Cyathus striatus]|nr:Rof/RNase P-like protein [Cyathus striatus]
MYASRIRGRKMLLENPARESKFKKELTEKRERRQQEKERKKLGVITRREAKEKGVWKFDEKQMKFDLFVPLHHLWMGYMSELLGLPHPTADPPSSKLIPGSAGMHPKLVKADFHGSMMTVRQSKNPALVNVMGIVIHETENTFKIITRENKVKMIPKRNSIFTFSVPLYSTLPKSHKPEAPFPILSPIEAPKTTVLDSPYIEFELHGNQFCFRAAERAGRKFKHKESIEL